GVFFTPLLRQFGWGRAQLSTLQGSLAISAGISAPLIGWLLDRVEARIVMVVGAAFAGVGTCRPCFRWVDRLVWILGSCRRVPGVTVVFSGNPPFYSISRWT